jgi:hypothetical protein
LRKRLKTHDAESVRRYVGRDSNPEPPNTKELSTRRRREVANRASDVSEWQSLRALSLWLHFIVAVHFIALYSGFCVQYSREAKLGVRVCLTFPSDCAVF